jgi:oxaloacetate decarboxylase alpha subunit
LGWPIVMTPFSQMLLTQAVMNVTGKERYGVVPDEVIRYALGKFGKPNVPIEPDVKDRIESLPRTRELRAEHGMPPLSELRKRIGPDFSDEEFLLRATMPAAQVDAMKAAGPAPQTYDPEMVPVMNLIRQLAARRDIAQISVEKAGFKLELKSQPRTEACA